MLASYLPRGGSWDGLYGSVKDGLKNLAEELRYRELRGLSFDNVEVNRIPCIRIFISIKTEFTRREEYIDYCKKESPEAGLLEEQLETVLSNVQSVTDNVAETIRGCDGLLQFYMGDLADTDRQWLAAEYFAACVLKKPHIRIVEKSAENEISRLEKDQAPIIVENNPAAHQIRHAIRDAFKQLVKKIEEAR